MEHALIEVAVHEIPQDEINRLSAALLRAVEAYYDQPGVREAFEIWKEERRRKKDRA